MIQIIDYQPQHQPYFERLNREWIEALFTMETLDEWVLTNPEKAILEPGGAILMAVYDSAITGTVGLRKIDPLTYEFTKMAVALQYRRRGIAEALSYASFIKAAALGARNIILYSNTRNAGAIRLYEKIGFRHVEVEKGVYTRANVKMVMDITSALQAANDYHQRIRS